MIQFAFVVHSDTIGDQTVHLQTIPQPRNKLKDTIRDKTNVNPNQKLYYDLFDNRFDTEKLRDIIFNQTRIDPFLNEFPLYIDFSKAVPRNEVVPISQPFLRRAVNRLGNLGRTVQVRFVNPLVQAFRNYFGFGSVKTIPYQSYDYNESLDGKCFYKYINKNYPKIGKKKKEQYNKEGVNIQEMVDFCKYYNIGCDIRNAVNESIYLNIDNANKSYKIMRIMLANNHVYVMKDKHRKYTNDFSNDKTYDIDYENEIFYTKGSFTYTNSGRCTSLDVEIDNAFFTGLPVNFNFESDCIKFKSLVYNHPKIETRLNYEYDMKKAFFNSINNFNGKIPCFSVVDLWEPYTNEHIVEYYYYSFSRSTLDSLRTYGFINNICSGYTINFLLDNNLLTSEHVEFVKKCSYVLDNEKIKQRIANLILKRNDYKMNSKTLAEIANDNKLDSDFVFYNGVLGSTLFRNCESIGGLSIDDYDLLNYNCEPDTPRWFIEEEHDNGVVYTKQSYDYFKNLNNTTIYNTVIEQCNLNILNEILHVKNKYNLMPLKIRVDAIGYEDEVFLSKPDLFKLESEHYFIKNEQKLIFKYKNISKKFYKVSPTFIDINTVIDNVVKEVGVFSKNICYTGPPGSGKTTKVQNNHSYNKGATVSNLCCLNMGSKEEGINTLFSLFGLYDYNQFKTSFKRLKNQTLWIDEFSMVENMYFNFFFILSKHYNVSIIFSGDNEQIGAFKGDKPARGIKTTFEDNFVLKELMGKIEYLTENWRNDPKIVKLREFVKNNKLDKKVLYTKFKYLPQISEQDWIKQDFHLVPYNTTRNYINQRIMEDRNLVFKIKKVKSEYSFNISKGIILKCKVNKKDKGLAKRDVWKVIDIDYEFGLYALQNKLRDDCYIELHESDMIYFEPGYAHTVHSSQGLTIKEPFTIHHTKGMIRWDPALLYTGITRGKNIENLNFTYDKEYKHSSLKKTNYISEVSNDTIKTCFDEFDD